MTDRSDWLAQVRDVALYRPPAKVSNPTVVVAIAMTYFDFGDPDGGSIQVGSKKVGDILASSEATVRRVRRWLEAEGLAHLDSEFVAGKKAKWWHAAMPETWCARCALSERREQATTDPAPGPTTDPAPGPTGGPEPVTRNRDLGSSTGPAKRWLDATHEQREQFAELVSAHGDPESIWTFLHDKQRATNPLAWATALESKGQLRGYLDKHLFNGIEVRTDPAIGCDAPAFAEVGGLQW